MFDSKKKMKLATAPEVTRKLTSMQMKRIDANNCLLAFYSNQVCTYIHRKCVCQCKTHYLTFVIFNALHVL